MKFVAAGSSSRLILIPAAAMLCVLSACSVSVAHVSTTETLNPAFAQPSPAAMPAQIVAPELTGKFKDALTRGNLGAARALVRDEPALLTSPIATADPAQATTPLHVAIGADQKEIVAWLLDQGASVEERAGGWTPLFRAAMEGHSEIIGVLLKHNADINGGANAADLADITPIRAAQLYGKLDTAQYLLEKGARIDFFSAAGLGWKTYVADHLAEDPSLATFRDHWNSEAIWIAVNTDQTEVVSFLMNHGSDFRGNYGHEGFTALHIAAERGFREMAVVLLNAGADVNAPDANGQTPLAYATNHKQDALATLLRVFGAKS